MIQFTNYATPPLDIIVFESKMNLIKLYYNDILQIICKLYCLLKRAL